MLDRPLYLSISTLSMRRTLLIVLLVLNAIVLLGQLWPEGAPPFARAVNIVFLLGVLVYLLNDLVRGQRRTP
jgi:hypothetical protein